MPAETIRVRIVWVEDAGTAPGTTASATSVAAISATQASVLPAGGGAGSTDAREGAGAHDPMVYQQVVEVPVGATISQALAVLETPGPAHAAGLRARIADGRLAIALFGRPVTGTTVLREDDRIELVGPLRADPKQARQHRVQRQREAGGDARWRRRADPGSVG